MSCHSSARPDPTRERAGTYGSWSAVSVRLPVCLGTASETMTFDAALKTFSFGSRRHLYPVAGVEHVGTYLLAYFIFAKVGYFEFLKVSVTAVGAFEMPSHRHVDLVRAQEADLHCLIAIALIGLDLSNNAWPDLDHRHRAGTTRVIVDRSHTNFASEQTRHRLRRFGNGAVACDSRLAIHHFLLFGRHL